MTDPEVKWWRWTLPEKVTGEPRNRDARVKQCAQQTALGMPEDMVFTFIRSVEELDDALEQAQDTGERDERWWDR